MNYYAAVKIKIMIADKKRNNSLTNYIPCGSLMGIAQPVFYPMQNHSDHKPKKNNQD